MTLPHSNAALVKVYLFFRFALVVALATLFLYSPQERFLGDNNAAVFVWTSFVYALICLLTIVLGPAKAEEDKHNWIYFSLGVDNVAMVLFMYSSGGLESSLGYLLLVFVAISGIFVRGRLGFAFAAMTSILVMAASVYQVVVEQADSKAIFSAGTLGILIFATTYTFQILSAKIQSSNAEAIRQANYAKHLQKLAQAIVTRMRTGILVVNEAHQIELINESALQMMNLPLDVDYREVNVAEISSLSAVFSVWQNNQANPAPQVLELRAGQHARVSLSTIDLGADSRTVIYLEDHRAMTQQAQQMKLASLGRLTASIAHEIRNPLGAIAHAAQLLEESPQLQKQDARLTEIILQHSQRVNDIVESTLSLSRRKEPQAEVLDLGQWIPRFINQYSTGLDVQIETKLNDMKYLVKVDPTHLSQVLTNLLDNGLRYSRLKTGIASAVVDIQRSPSNDTHFVDVIDYGDGIAEEQIASIFDPFYTTDTKGSGLGLYISKELCEINQATLHYRRSAKNESCFRIEFSHYQRLS